MMSETVHHILEHNDKESVPTSFMVRAHRPSFVLIIAFQPLFRRPSLPCLGPVLSLVLWHCSPDRCYGTAVPISRPVLLDLTIPVLPRFDCFKAVLTPGRQVVVPCWTDERAHEMMRESRCGLSLIIRKVCRLPTNSCLKINTKDRIFLSRTMCCTCF